MSAYLVARVEIDDPEAYGAYTAKSPAIIERFGGRFLARGGALETLEGEDFHGRLVIVEFPDLQAARSFYFSPEYQEARAIRMPVSKAQFVVIEGV